MSEAYPLHWPAEWPRSKRTQTSKFSRKVDNGRHTETKAVTIAEAGKPAVEITEGMSKSLHDALIASQDEFVPPSDNQKLREALERIADECEGTAPDGNIVGIASKCHRIARAALAQSEGGEKHV